MGCTRLSRIQDGQKNFPIQSRGHGVRTEVAAKREASQKVVLGMQRLEAPESLGLEHVRARFQAFN